MTQDGRKDPFADFKGIGQTSREPLDILSNRPTEAKRNRAWEKRNPVRGYRGIPDEVHTWLLEMSAKEGIDVGELVRFGLERFKKDVEEGRVDLKAKKQPIIGKNTLYK